MSIKAPRYQDNIIDIALFASKCLENKGKMRIESGNNPTDNADMRKRTPPHTLPATKPPGCNIRKLREDLDWSQKDLADRIGANVSTISRLERSEEINMEKVELCARALGVTTEMLLLPPELMAYARLSEERRARIVEAVRDSYVAQHSGNPPPRLHQNPALAPLTSKAEKK